MPPFDIDGIESYRVNARAMVTDLQARVVAQAERYESLVAAIAAVVEEFREQGSQYFAERVSAVLDGHLKEQS